MCGFAADVTKPFRQGLRLDTSPVVFRGSFGFCRVQSQAPFLLTNVNIEVIPLLGEMSALADKRVPVFRRKSVGALYARLRGIILDVRY